MILQSLLYKNVQFIPKIFISSWFSFVLVCHRFLQLLLIHSGKQLCVVLTNVLYKISGYAQFLVFLHKCFFVQRLEKS